MHFNADDASVKMMMDLTSSANDLCIAFGICDYLGKFSEIGVESRRNSASVVPCSKSRRTSLSLDLGLLQLRMSEVVLRQRRETSCYNRINQQECQLSKERTTRQTKNFIDSVKIADYAEIFNIGELHQTRPARNSAGMLSIPCGEVDRPTSVEGGQLLRRISPRSRIGPIKERNIFQRRRKRGH